MTSNVRLKWGAGPDGAARARMLEAILSENAAHRETAARRRTAARRAAAPAAACLVLAAAAVTAGRLGLLTPPAQKSPKPREPWVVEAPAAPGPFVTVEPAEGPSPPEAEPSVSLPPLTPVSPEETDPLDPLTPVSPGETDPLGPLTPATPDAGEETPGPEQTPTEPVFIPRKMGGGSADAGSAPRLEEFRSRIEQPEAELPETLPVYRRDDTAGDGVLYRKLSGFPGDMTEEELRALLESDPALREALEHAGITDPVISRTAHYGFYGERRDHTDFTVWQNADDLPERMRSRGMAPVLIMLRGESSEATVIARSPELFTAVADYPSVSREDALARLEEQEGVGEEEVLAWELTYTDRLYEDYYVPAYVFYYEVTPYPMPEEGTKRFQEALLDRADEAYEAALPDEEAAEQARREVLERGTLTEEDVHLYRAVYIDAVKLPPWRAG